MINRMSLSNRVWQGIGNWLIGEHDCAIQFTKNDHFTANHIIVEESELHVGYMNIGENTTLLILKGQIDGNTYETLINIGEALTSLKVDCLVVDMSDVLTLTNSGLVALNNLIRLMNGKSSTDISHGWKALHEMEEDFRAGIQPHVKILCPQPQILNILMKSGITRICETFDHIDKALKPLGWIAKD